MASPVCPIFLGLWLILVANASVIRTQCDKNKSYYMPLIEMVEYQAEKDHNHEVSKMTIKLVIRSTGGVIDVAVKWTDYCGGGGPCRTASADKDECGFRLKRGGYRPRRGKQTIELEVNPVQKSSDITQILRNIHVEISVLFGCNTVHITPQNVFDLYRLYQEGYRQLLHVGAMPKKVVKVPNDGDNATLNSELAVRFFHPNDRQRLVVRPFDFRCFRRVYRSGGLLYGRSVHSDTATTNTSVVNRLEGNCASSFSPDVESAILEYEWRFLIEMKEGNPVFMLARVETEVVRDPDGRRGPAGMVVHGPEFINDARGSNRDINGTEVRVRCVGEAGGAPRIDLMEYDHSTGSLLQLGSTEDYERKKYSFYTFSKEYYLKRQPVEGGWYKALFYCKVTDRSSERNSVEFQLRFPQN